MNYVDRAWPRRVGFRQNLLLLLFLQGYERHSRVYQSFVGEVRLW